MYLQWQGVSGQQLLRIVITIIIATQQEIQASQSASESQWRWHLTKPGTPAERGLIYRPDFVQRHWRFGFGHVGLAGWWNSAHINIWKVNLSSPTALPQSNQWTPGLFSDFLRPVQIGSCLKHDLDDAKRRHIIIQFKFSSHLLNGILLAHISPPSVIWRRMRTR